MPHPGPGRIRTRVYEVAGVTTSGEQILRYVTDKGSITAEEARGLLVRSPRRRNTIRFGNHNLKPDFFKDKVNDLSPENRGIFDQIPRTSE